MMRRAAERVGTATISGACALAVVREQPRPSGGSSTIAEARAVRPGPLTMTSRHIATARRRDAEDRAERTHLEVLGHRLDVMIDACERAHLDDLVDAPAGLAARARAAIAAATAALTAADQDLVEEVAWNVASWARAGVRIADVMDVVWEVQGGVFNLLIPARRGLPDEVRIEEEAEVERAVTRAPRPPWPPARLRRPVTSDRATDDAVSIGLAVTWADLFRSAQQIWAWPVGSPERALLCAAYTRAVNHRMPKRRAGAGIPRTMPATRDVLPPGVSHRCAYCGQWCEGEGAAGVRYCSTEHLLLARITGVGGGSQTCMSWGWS